MCAVDIIGMNQATSMLVDRFGVHDKPDVIDTLMRDIEA
jgi:SulP family sulfate permease